MTLAKCEAVADKPGVERYGPGDASILLPYIDPKDLETVRESLGSAQSRLVSFNDIGRMGGVKAYMHLWNSVEGDVILWHSDMFPIDSETWYDQLMSYVQHYPKVGIFGCKLLYPLENDGYSLVQSAGGFLHYKTGEPFHYGGGVDIYDENGVTYACEPVQDKGQFEKVRKVHWVTFGGCYIRRAVLDAVGETDGRYRIGYYSDVDYCLRARQKGFPIYYVPVPILHFEGKDNKKRDDIKLIIEENKNIFLEKWKPSLLEKWRRRMLHKLNMWP